MAAIDVLMPVRNAMPFLPEAIESIVNQTFSDWRLLVLDHGSSDGSLELARWRSQTDRRISVFSCPQAESLAALRNLGLSLCDCRYLMLQDADDVSFANRMKLTACAFASTPELLAVGGDAVVIDTYGKRRGYLRMPADPKAVAAASFFYYPMLHPTTAVDFHAFKRLGATYGADILNTAPGGITVKCLAEDYVLFGQLALLGPCANIEAPLIRYRRHKKSVGIVNPVAQIETALRISRFLARSFCHMHGLDVFDPGPFCNHADYVFDFGRRDYTGAFSQMADALRRGLGHSAALERELAFRRVLAARNSGEMALRYLSFLSGNVSSPAERRTVRNWLLRSLRHGKYVYRPNDALAKMAI
jgi:glycosyltransferase involved in cell wall biosynthesis